MWKEFREFAMRGNVADMAIGIIIGAAFGAIVKSLVDDVLMPPIGWLLGDLDFLDFFLVLKSGNPGPPYLTLAAAREAGAVTLNYGVLINNIISFMIVAWAVFLLIRQINRQRDAGAKKEPDTKPCPYCLSDIALKATRCRHCTSNLPA